MSSTQLPKLPEIGDLISSRFRITELIGAGGFGTVYRAIQENVGREVALKFLSPSVAKDPVNIERFRREAFHVSQLRHPNTITLYDYGQTDEGLFFMVLEILEGLSLADEIQDHGGIAPERASHIFLQILKSLTEAHQRGLVHRDLKPENIHLCEMFGEQDYVKVLDFGVAKMTMFDNPDEVEDKLTKAGRIFGTPMYMAPEQACAEPITTATDIYALGLMLFEILTGLPPVTGRNRMDVIHKQIRDEVPKLTKALKGTPFGDIIRVATRKDPKTRYPDASSMLEAFGRAVRAQRIFPAPKGSTMPEMASYDIGLPASALPPSIASAPSLPVATPPPVPSAPSIPQSTDSVMTSLPGGSSSLKHSGAVSQAPVAPHGVIGVEEDDDDRTVIESVPQTYAEQILPTYQELSLIGRDPDLSKLMDIVAQGVRAKRGHVILLEGEGGVGKTRVVGTLRQILHGQGVGMCLGAFERAGAPLDAIREAMAAYWWVNASPRAEVARVIRADLDALGVEAQDVEFLIDFIRPQRNKAMENAEATSSLFARLEKILLKLADLRPFVLALEDIQFADSASLSFLEYFSVTLRAQAVPLIILLTLRATDRNASTSVERSLRAINTNLGSGLSRHRVRRLKGRDLSVFLDAILPLEARLKERIAWLSQGNPEHAIQIVHYLWAEGNLKSEQNRWSLVKGTARQIDLPPDLIDMMSLRVAQSIESSPNAQILRQILTWVATLGIRVPYELASRVIVEQESLTREGLGEHIEKLRGFGVLHQRMHRDILCVEFDNSLLREALLQEVTRSTESRAMHNIAAHAKLTFYDRQDVDMPMLEIAEHWRQSGMDKEYRDALFKAAKRSMHRHDPRGAREQFLELLRILDEQDEPGSMWGKTMTALAELSRRFGELGLAEDNYRAALGSQVLDVRERADAERGLAHLLFALGRYTEAVEHYDRALEYSTTSKDAAGEAKALIGLSRVHLRQGDPNSGQKVRTQLINMLPQMSTGALSGQVLLHLAEAALRLGDMGARYTYLRRALKHFKQGQDRQGYSDTLTELGAHLTQPNENSPQRLAEAGKILREALEIKRAIGDRQGIADVFKFLGFVEQEVGDFEAAEHFYHQSLKMHQALGALFNIGTAHNSLGLANSFMGRHQEASSHFGKAIELFEKVGDDLAASHAMLNHGLAMLNAQRVDDAVELLQQTRDIKESLGSSWGLHELYNNLSIGWLWSGRLGDAQKLLERTVEQLGERDISDDKTVAHTLLGLVHLFEGRLQTAALEFGRASNDAPKLGSQKVSALCAANSALYAAVTKDSAMFAEVIPQFNTRALLGDLRAPIWLELIEACAKANADRDPSYGNTLLRAVAKCWEAFGQRDRAGALRKRAASRR